MISLEDYTVNPKNFIGVFDLDLNKYEKSIDSIVEYWKINADNVLKKNKDNLRIGNIDVYRNPLETVNDNSRRDNQLFLSSLDSPSLLETEEFYVSGSHISFYNAVTSECLRLYQETFSVLSSVKWIQYNVKLQVTLPSGGFHTWHFENGNVEVSRRILTSMLYLNDDYEYGETEFLYQGLRINPKKGRFCIFPASFTHTHRGNPPVNGNKIILTSWVEIL